VDENTLSLFDIVDEFGLKALSVRPIRGGLINETFAVRTSSSGTWILQAVNPIFAPEVQIDIDHVTNYLRDKGLVSPKLRSTTAGQLWLSADDKIWRMMNFIEGVSVNRATSTNHAREAGMILGDFHVALRDFEHEFHSVREGIHDTAHHVSFLRKTLGETQFKDHENYEAVSDCAEQILTMADHLEELPSQSPSIVHGDPKISNIRYNRDTGRAICLVDLDTVGRMPSLLELGDAFRSWCNAAPSGEDEPEPEFSMPLFEASVGGYAKATGKLLSQQEAAAIPDATLLISLELACRFAADALHEKYFGWNHAQFPSAGEHHLIRARGQLRLAQSLESQLDAARAIVKEAFDDAAK
jgi:Ser/Thr protein kinase RdoA (MazF antagonist)